MNNSRIHHRRSIRLQDYDYSQAGAYFVTICVQGKECLFGAIENGAMMSNEAGRMMEKIWNGLTVFYPGVAAGTFVVMPNHIHGIIHFVGAGPRACPVLHAGQPRVGANGQPQGVAPTALSLGDVVHRFESMTARRYADGVNQHGWQPFCGRLWQRNYYEHIIRNEDDYRGIAEYIGDNPRRWEEDTLHPDAMPSP
ncbi:MAG: transposase [Gallionella sp.]|nr:transposase [Gallionella sp.]